MTLPEGLNYLLAHGFWADSVPIDRMIVERQKCPQCKTSFLIYQGLSNATEYRAYGHCQDCGFYKKLWTETLKVEIFKTSMSKPRKHSRWLIF